MMQILLVGVGAGAASALLFASVSSGSPLSVLLFYLAPLPILIAALGWSHWAALVAAITAALGLTAALGGLFFLAFLTGVGVPAWWLGYLALLARPHPSHPQDIEWYPAGMLVLWAALLGAAMVIVAILNFGMDEEAFRAALRRSFERILQTEASAQDAERTANASRVIDILVVIVPLAAATLATATNVINLWLAGRVVRTSGHLRRPWPDLSTITFPNYAPVLLGIAFAGTLLGGFPGTLSSVLVSSLLMAYTLLGFAVLHSITRGIRFRGALLIVAYAMVIHAVGLFFTWTFWPLLLMPLLGLLDTVIDLRGRVAGKRGPPAFPT